MKLVAMLSLALLVSLLGLSSGLQTAVGPTRLSRPALRIAGQRALFARMSVGEEEEVIEEEAVEDMTEEEYLAEMAAEEAGGEELSEDAERVYRGMRSSSGVEFAPWMKVDAEKIALAKKERLARKQRAAAAAQAQDGISMDPQAAELSGTGGLTSKVLSEDEVELRWSTGDEEGNAGFIVQRRQGGSNTFQDLESFETFAPLRTKGPAGGTYTYLDDTVAPGTFVYRILDCDVKGVRSGICQKLVEVESASEQTQTLVVGAVIATLALALVAAGIFADPIQTTSAGRGF